MARSKSKKSMAECKRQKAVLAFGLFYFVFSMGVSACATFSSDEPYAVVERSKEQAPSWVNQTSEKLVETESQLTFLSVRTHIINLPHGIKETQLSALSASESALLGKVRDQVAEIVSQAQISVTNSDELEKLQTKIVKEAHGKSVGVADIYFEKLRTEDASSELREYYQVYVLIDLRTLRTAEVLKSVGNALKNSPKSDLKKIGNGVAERVSRIISH